MTDEELAAIEVRADAATEGPWEVRRPPKGEPGTDVYAPAVPWLVCKFPVPPDSRFIAHAREDIPALIVEVRRLREKVQAVDWDDVISSLWCFEQDRCVGSDERAEVDRLVDSVEAVRDLIS